MKNNTNKLFLAIIADDLTGCGDTGYLLAKAGIPSEIIVSANQSLKNLKFNCPVVILNTESRNCSPDKSYDSVFKVAMMLKKIKPRFIYKKVDSTLRGNIGRELDALLDVFDLPCIGFVPAYPRMGRYTKNLRHFVGKTPLDRTFFADDPRNPIKTSYLPELIEEKSRYRDRIRYFNVICQGDLKYAANSLKGSLFSGAAGLLEELLEKWIKKDYVKPKRDWPAMNTKSLASGNILVVNGSMNPVSIRQVSYIAEKFKGRGLKVMSGVSAKISMFRFNKAGNLAIIESKTGKKCQSKEVLKEILALAQRVNQMYNLSYLLLSGGETAYYLCRKLKISRLFPVGGEAWGVALCSSNRDFSVVLKPGGFGGRNLLGKIISRFSGGE